MSKMRKTKKANISVKAAFILSSFKRFALAFFKLSGSGGLKGKIKMYNVKKQPKMFKLDYCYWALFLPKTT